MREITYLIYIIFWEALIFGGFGYAIIFRNFSGWWILVAILMSSQAYSPERWIHGIVNQN